MSNETEFKRIASLRRRSMGMIIVAEAAGVVLSGAVMPSMKVGGQWPNLLVALCFLFMLAIDLDLVSSAKIGVTPEEYLQHLGNKRRYLFRGIAAVSIMLVMVSYVVYSAA